MKKGDAGDLHRLRCRGRREVTVRVGFVRGFFPPLFVHGSRIFHSCSRGSTFLFDEEHIQMDWREGRDRGEKLAQGSWQLFIVDSV